MSLFLACPSVSGIVMDNWMLVINKRKRSHIISLCVQESFYTKTWLPLSCITIPTTQWCNLTMPNWLLNRDNTPLSVEHILIFQTVIRIHSWKPWETRYVSTLSLGFILFMFIYQSILIISFSYVIQALKLLRCMNNTFLIKSKVFI